MKKLIVFAVAFLICTISSIAAATISHGTYYTTFGSVSAEDSVYGSNIRFMTQFNLKANPNVYGSVGVQFRDGTRNSDTVYNSGTALAFLDYPSSRDHTHDYAEGYYMK